MEQGTYKWVKHPNQHTHRLFYRLKVFIKQLVVFFTKLTALSFVLSSIFIAGSLSNPEHITAITTESIQDFPVLQRIAGCESEGNHNSKGSQFDSKGRLRTNVNADKTIDIGKNMINSHYWELKAVTLGYNIYTEEGNDAMAKWIYLNKGTGDWSASAKCWK